MRKIRRNIVLLLLFLMLLCVPISSIFSQKNIKIAVLPFLVKTDDGNSYNDKYGYDLSELITTKLYYSTTADILSMLEVRRALRISKLLDLENVSETRLYLLAERLGIDYILIPRIIISGDEYRMEGSVYEVGKRDVVKYSVVKGEKPDRYIFNDIDKFSEELFGKLLHFSEIQPILKPAKISNLDLVLYFNLNDSEFEYYELKKKFDDFIQLFGNNTLGDNIRIGFVFSKNFKGTDKFLAYDFSDIIDLNIHGIPLVDSDLVENFYNSPYDSIEKALENMAWSLRKNNERVLTSFTKSKIHSDIDEFSNFLNERNIACVYNQLENTSDSIFEHNRSISLLCNGISVPLSYIITVPTRYPMRSKYVLNEGIIYEVEDNTSNVKDDESDGYKYIEGRKVISYDLFVSNIDRAIQFLYESGYSLSSSKKDNNVEIKTSIESSIVRSINSLYEKNLHLFKDIVIYNEGVIKTVPIPLYVAEKILSKYSNADLKDSGKRSLIIGARIIPTETDNGFELDPFTLIFPRKTSYIPSSLIVKNFEQISSNPEYYSKNGILDKNIWFFRVELLRILD